jgi:hypothetical protein
VRSRVQPCGRLAHRAPREIRGRLGVCQHSDILNAIDVEQRGLLHGVPRLGQELGPRVFVAYDLRIDPTIAKDRGRRRQAPRKKSPRAHF